MQAEKIEPIYLVRTTKFYRDLLMGFAAILLVLLLDPSLLPFKLFEFWYFKWDWSELKNLPWAFLVLGPVLVFVYAIASRHSEKFNKQRIKSLKSNMLTSVLAGVFEEVSYRWIYFYLAIIWYAFLLRVASLPLGEWLRNNWFFSLVMMVVIFFVGVVAWAVAEPDNVFKVTDNTRVIAYGVIVLMMLCLVPMFSYFLYFSYIHLFNPIANIMMRKSMNEELYGYGPAVGVAIMIVNVEFRNGHASQGLLGMILTWFFGMIMFWMVFNFGLFAAILCHVLYDLAIDVVGAIDSTVELAEWQVKRG